MRIEAPVVYQPGIDLVGEYPDVRMTRKDFGNGVEILAVEDAAGRVVRRVENQQPGIRRDPRFEFRRVERESTGLAKVDWHRHGAVGVNLRFVDRKPGHRVDHLVADAEVRHRGDRVGDEGLGARANDHVVRPDVEAAPRAQIVRGSRAQLVDPGARRVAVPAAADCRDCSLLHVFRRRKIGLSDAEGNDVPALPNQCVHLGQDDECIFGAERLRAAREFGQRHGVVMGCVHRFAALRCFR